MILPLAMSLKDLTIAGVNRWPSRCPDFNFMKQFSMFVTLAAASGGSAPSR